MATVFPYRWSRTEHLTLRPPCHGGDPLDAHQPLPWILLDVRAYIADRRNSTTAAADLGNGHHLYRPTAAGILHLCLVHLTNKVDASDEKAVVLAVDMANKRLQTVSVYDAERIVDDFDYSYTQSTISQYFTTAAGVKGNLKRPLKFHAQYPHKRLGETISRSDNPMDLHEPLQLDIGFGLGTKDETEDSDNPMDLE
ncbi:hypothetical protein OsJ_25313 [Oryza sativa Japonica Group]|uniref:Uncharacterized protein n=1 Tax=Oryza sativa subsp. japonica TaxID=39947 RepID=B9FUG8_ORYSJ|nr:hypothetical protein OsJ_25313 [Oryza sativa Japonica Group]